MKVLLLLGVFLSLTSACNFMNNSDSNPSGGGAGGGSGEPIDQAALPDLEPSQEPKPDVDQEPDSGDEPTLAVDPDEVLGGGPGGVGMQPGPKSGGQPDLEPEPEPVGDFSFGIGGKGDDDITDISPDLNGDLLVVGNTRSENISLTLEAPATDDNRPYMAIVRSGPSISQRKVFPKSELEMNPLSVEPLKNGGYVIVGACPYLRICAVGLSEYLEVMWNTDIGKNAPHNSPFGDLKVVGNRIYIAYYEVPVNGSETFGHLLRLNQNDGSIVFDHRAANGIQYRAIVPHGNDNAFLFGTLPVYQTLPNGGKTGIERKVIVKKMSLQTGHELSTNELTSGVYASVFKAKLDSSVSPAQIYFSGHALGEVFGMVNPPAFQYYYLARFNVSNGMVEGAMPIHDPATGNSNAYWSPDMSAIFTPDDGNRSVCVTRDKGIVQVDLDEWSISWSRGLAEWSAPLALTPHRSCAAAIVTSTPIGPSSHENGRVIHFDANGDFL